MNELYQIKEYGSFINERELPGYTTLPKRAFEQLETFILTNKSERTDVLELLGISIRKGIGKVITAKNYVGVITLADGTIIEILPKIYSNETESEVRVKKLLVDMIKSLQVSPYKTVQTSQVNVEKMNIYDIFIRIFIDEVFCIVKRGLKCDYEKVESNENLLKGKLMFSEHIKRNFTHKERSYVEFYEYTNNRPENRLIKSTLQYLSHQSRFLKNKSDLKTLLNEFGDVEYSKDYKGDYQKFIPDRSMKDYESVLLWCKIFLEGKSFTSYSGSEVATALLFSMETLFESYIASKIKNILDATHYSVSVQDKTYHLFEEPDQRFLLKPDIVVRRKADLCVFILDTKWKVLSYAKSNYGISQSDMYQMYAYQKKYNAKKVILLYPMTEHSGENLNLNFEAEDGAKIQIHFIDLFHVNENLKKLVQKFNDKSDKQGGI